MTILPIVVLTDLAVAEVEVRTQSMVAQEALTGLTAKLDLAIIEVERGQILLSHIMTSTFNGLNSKLEEVDMHLGAAFTM